LKILFDINHPAHVHLYKNLIGLLREKGHRVFVVAKQIPAVEYLLNIYKIDFFKAGKKYDSLWLKYLIQLKYLVYYLSVVRKNKINLGIGVSMTLPLISKFRPSFVSIGMDDDDVSATPVFGKYVSKSNVVFTPACLAGEKRSLRHFGYNSYHELFYLHPNRFTPDRTVLEELAVKEGESFFILRFNAFKAHHDLAEYGLSLEQKQTLVSILLNYGKVFISNEADEKDKFLNQFSLKLSPEKIHSALYYATLFLGDSKTMCSEAAVLGTPAVKCNTFAGRLSVPNELEEKYGLCYAFLPSDFEGFLAKVKALLQLPGLKKEWQKRRKKMLKDKIDATAFMFSFIENYPKSLEIFKKANYTADYANLRQN